MILVEVYSFVGKDRVSFNFFDILKSGISNRVKILFVF